MKFYAKQVPPDQQQSNILDDDYWKDSLILLGNRDYSAHTTPEYDKIAQYIFDIADDYMNANYLYFYKDGRWQTRHRAKPTSTIAEILLQYNISAPTSTGKWSPKALSQWKKIFEDDIIDSDENILTALCLVTCKTWCKTTLRGCTQSEWQEAIYITDVWPCNKLDHFACELFNTGTEWIIHDDDTIPETPDEITGYSVYCYSYGEDLRKELASFIGCSCKDLILYECNMTHTTTYHYNEI